MKVDFEKYHGTSNDFIIIDNRENIVQLDNKTIVRLCDRRTGIGADGVILLEEEKGYDFRMVYFNSDGTQSMCGNGGRCIVQYAFDHGIRPAADVASSNDGDRDCPQWRYSFTAVDGPHAAVVDSTTGLVRLLLADVEQVEYGVCGGSHHGRDTGSDGDSVSGWGVEYCVLDTGSPHYIVLPPDGLVSADPGAALRALDVAVLGRDIRHSSRFAATGINVNFLVGLNPDCADGSGPEVVGIRTFERGVEAETHSCGTGCAAAAIAVTHQRLMRTGSGLGAAADEGNGTQCEVHMQARGGDLAIHFRANKVESSEGGFRYSDVWLVGPGVFAFSGTVVV